LYGKKGSLSPVLPLMNDQDIFTVYGYGRREPATWGLSYWERARLVHDSFEDVRIIIQEENIIDLIHEYCCR